MKELNDIQPSTSSTDENSHSKNEINNRKRRASSTPKTTSSSKRFIANEEDDGIFKLLDFTDEVLLEILQHCDCTTLYALSKTCTRFLTLIQDRRLWKMFDFATKRLMGRRIKKLLSTLQICDIKEFNIRGFVSKCPSEKWKNKTITLNILRKLSSSCPCLEKIELRECYINFRKVKISDFPRLLKCLKFHGCQISLPRSPRLFTKIDDYLQLLEEIAVEKCSWFETHDLVVFSKLPHLKRLSLRGCPTLKGCVPYGSIATRFGFKCLEYLDVRDTPISDSDIQCFNITSTLREILMDCPVEFRDIITSGTDDSESYEPKSYIDDALKETSENKEKNATPSNSGSNSNSNSCADNCTSKDTVSKQQHEQKSQQDENKISISDTEESDSDEDSDCSTDSENNSSDDDQNGGDKVSGGSADLNQPSQPHCIQVILQNGRMVNVNAEQSNDFDNPLRETNGLRCVIGIFNGRDSNDPRHRVFAAPFRYQRQQPEQQQPQQQQPQQQQQQQQEQQQQSEQLHSSNSSSSNNHIEPEQNEAIDRIIADSFSITETKSQNAEKSNFSDNKNDIPSNSNKNDENVGDDSANQPGTSGLQTNQNDSTNASELNSHSTTPSNENTVNMDKSSNDDQAAGPSNRQPVANKSTPANQRLIIVQHRRSQNNDENGNMNRQISWEVRNLSPLRYQKPMFNGYYITDRGMCSFGMARRSVQEGIIWIRAERRAPDTLLERITVRNYLDVTDVTLRHLALCAPNLRYLDVTGTSVTLKGINKFLKEKPECQVISDFSELLET